jgi:hypothetical protein
VASLLFVLRRARRHWQVLLTLTLGVILVTALMSSGPLLAQTVVEMGLHLTFQSSSAPDSNLRLTAAAVDQVDARALDGEVRDLLGAALGKHLDRTIHLAQSAWAFPWLDGEPTTDQRVNLRSYEGTEEHLEYVAGGWPVGPNSKSGVIPVVIGDAMARALVLRVGQRLPLSLRPGYAEPDAWLEVAGIVRPKDPLDPYWFGEYNPFTIQSTPPWSAQYSAIVP